MPTTTPRFTFNCSNGCGACDVKLREFETSREETMSGDLIARHSEPEIVTACCGAPVDVWDSMHEDTCGMADLVGRPKPRKDKA